MSLALVHTYQLRFQRECAELTKGIVNTKTCGVSRSTLIVDKRGPRLKRNIFRSGSFHGWWGCCAHCVLDEERTNQCGSAEWLNEPGPPSASPVPSLTDTYGRSGGPCDSAGACRTHKGLFVLISFFFLQSQLYISVLCGFCFSSNNVLSPTQGWVKDFWVIFAECQIGFFFFASAFPVHVKHGTKWSSPIRQRCRTSLMSL